ncbi:hypothetical protein JCM3765_003820 [Sporobolomyces pararoseus]
MLAVTSQKTFASLARTSKLFLPLARSRLYYRPILRSSASVSWDKALSLASSLGTPLGQLVVSLEGIVHFIAKMGQLEEPSTSLPFQLRGYTTTFSLYYKILSSCPQLVFVEIICNSRRHLSKLLNALENSLSTLKTVKFANSRYSDKCLIDTDLVCQALRRLSAWNVDEIILDDVDSCEQLSGDPSGPLSLQSLSVASRYNRSDVYKPLFPRDSSSLSSISIRIDCYSDSAFDWILDYLPSSLRQLSFDAADPLDILFSRQLQSYLERRRPSLHPSKFTRFTSLTRVSLRGFDGPSLALLDTLSLASPSICLLHFENSDWVNLSSPSTSFPIVDDSIPSLLNPAALLDCLLKFEKLKSVHLGVLPTRTRETFRELEEEIEKKRSIKVEWQLCY